MLIVSLSVSSSSESLFALYCCPVHHSGDVSFFLSLDKDFFFSGVVEESGFDAYARRSSSAFLLRKIGQMKSKSYMSNPFLKSHNQFGYSFILGVIVETKCIDEFQVSQSICLKI